MFADIPSGGLLDFVAAWYVKATEYMNPRHSRARGNPEPDAQNPDFRAGGNDCTRGAFRAFMWKTFRMRPIG
ncbi:MAG: hypothetical protein AB7O86_14410 [Porticoccaceae bacterium]